MRSGAAAWHYPGSVPASTALRILLAHAGVRAPHTGQPYSEAMVFGIAGGVGIGCCSFYYPKEDFASLYLAGRHLWADDAAYVVEAGRRFGCQPQVAETGGQRTAENQLRQALAHGPCIAWVDAAHLPHRAMPAQWSGGGYHLVTVYHIDGERGCAMIGDLSDEPVPIPMADLATARHRIKKQKNRLVTFSAGENGQDLPRLVFDGIRRCCEGLTKQRYSFFTLETLKTLGERLCGGGEESWERVFARGHRAWNGLISMYDFIEHYGTGGGLCRPLFAEFLSEAADALGDATLRLLGERYQQLGRAWSELASAALPDDKPAFREARQLLVEKAELVAAGGPPEAMSDVWTRLDRLQKAAKSDFPLSEAQYGALRDDLRSRVLAIYEQERAACTALGETIA